MSADRFASIVLPAALAGAADRYVFDCESVRALDRAAIDEFAIPGIVLMENAATALAHVAHAMCGVVGSNVLIVCGPGNNGGDGFALARKLSNLGAFVRLVSLCPRQKYKGDAAVNLNIVERMKLPISFSSSRDVTNELEAAWSSLGECGLLVDALFGTGLTEPPRSPFDVAITWMNAQRSTGQAATLAVDLPSGLDCDVGTPLDEGAVVHADVTVTLAGWKRGLLAPASRAYSGAALAADIGVPCELLDRFGERIDGAH